MSDIEDNSESAKTVFMPSTPPQAAPPEPNPDATQFQAPPEAVSRPPVSLAPVAPGPAPAPAAGEGRVAVGMVLNHIFEVRRFIARGGMGEVYEGINVNTDERVAIKVMLPHLAADPAVQAMFRKEARTLTRLQHPALVQYRVLAQEPTVGALYIVTEYIDGAQLSDVIGGLRPSEDELIGLTRRLAAGLEAAHALGAIHRDIAPDNVLLPEGRLPEAKIIDFGIAKDLDPSSKTIVGDGFAGKLGFVAPEQFGDFNREVGPWTDVYSLALVVLSLAAGRPIDMGSTLVEAIEKRRAGPDLSVAPGRLRPVLEGMLRPHPAERFRSMSEVLRALDAATAAASPPATATPAQKPAAKAFSSKLGLILAGAAVVVVAVTAFLLTWRHAPAPAVASSSPAAPAATDVALRDSEKVRRAVEAALPSASCSWIDIDGVHDTASGVSVSLSGVAGSPAEAQQIISKAAQATGARVGLIDAVNVFPVASGNCAPLDAFRAFREPNSEFGRRLTSPQAQWRLSAKNDPCVGPNAKVVVNLRIGNPQQNFSVIGMDKAGGLQQIFADRAGFNAYHAQFPDFVTDKGGDSFSSTVCYNETGVVGQLLVLGQGPFDLGLPNAMVSNKSQPVDAAWLKRFADAAKAGGWKTDMVWYRVVNQAG
jgi:serine/threonine-protein kinase